MQSLQNSFNHYLDHAHDFIQSHIQQKGMRFLSLVGFLYLTYKSFGAIRFLSRTFLTVGFDLPKRYTPGSWVVITGGAQGIGAAFAHQLAAKGFNLVLIDINKEKLEEQASFIHTNFPHTKLKTIVLDFSDSWKEGFFDSLLEQLNGLDISILINNVGAGTAVGPFSKNSERSVLRCIAVNILPTTLLTRRIIPQMLNRPTRSAIINISSISGAFICPNIAVYSSTKAYVDFFSRAIQHEVGHKIDVISVRPDAVSTSMTRNPALSLVVISPESVARSALKKLGVVDSTFGHWRHEIRGLLYRNTLIANMSLEHFYKSILKVPEEMLRY